VELVGVIVSDEYRIDRGDSRVDQLFAHVG
jgi:hypothetical protein